jgi:hypothetical protein
VLFPDKISEMTSHSVEGELAIELQWEACTDFPACQVRAVVFPVGFTNPEKR